MGMSPLSIDKSAVTERQFGDLLGNSMGVNVLERLLLRVLPAAGLVPYEAMTKQWESLAAAEATIRTRRA